MAESHFLRLGSLSGHAMNQSRHQGKGQRRSDTWRGKLRKAASTVLERLGERRLLSAGQLDTTFAGTGKVHTDFNGGQDDGNAIVALGDGGVAVGGSFASAFGLARYNADGSLAWTSRTPISGLSVANAMVLSGDKFVLAGFSVGVGTN